MIAIPAAAAVPVSSVGGMVQKGPSMAKAPAMARLVPRTTANAECEKAASSRPQVPIMAENTICHRLSAFRSEGYPFAAIAIAAARLGTAVSSPIVKLLNPDRLLITVGSQSVMP